MKKLIIVFTIFCLGFFSTIPRMYAKQIVITIHYKSGSGFFISPNGHIVTNAHVINQCHSNTIYMLRDNKIDKKIPLNLIVTDEKNDLAILKSPQPHNNYINFSNSHDLLKEKETIFMAGYPNGSKTLDFKKTGFKRYDETQMASLLFDNIAHHGNSGGALINQSGHLVGVVQGTVSLKQTIMYVSEDKNSYTNIYNKQEQSSAAISLHKLENLMMLHNIQPHKQSSEIIKTDSDIHNEAKNYMVHIICN